MNSENNFYMFLPSGSSSTFYPDNKPQEYNTRLVHPLELKGDWEVALIETHIPSMWRNVTNKNNTFELLYQTVMQEQSGVYSLRHFNTEADVSKISMSFPGQKASQYDYILSLHNQLAAVDINNEKYSLNFFLNKPDDGFLSIIFNLHDGYSLYFDCPESYNFTLEGILCNFLNIDRKDFSKKIVGPKEFKILLVQNTMHNYVCDHDVYVFKTDNAAFEASASSNYSYSPVRSTRMITVPEGYYSDRKHLIKALNESVEPFSMDMISFSLTENNRLRVTSNCSELYNIRFNNSINKEFASMLGLQEQKLGKKWLISNSPFESSIIFKYQLDSKMGVYGFYIYSDIVTQQFVGDKFANLLRVVPTGSAHDEINVNIFPNPYYLPLSRNYITNIHVEIKSNTDDFIVFEGGSVMCKLHFRKK
jgi:hypothetical protein